MDTKGLKFCVMLFSGELSITSSLPLVAGALELEVEVAVLEAPGALLVELLDEQAASPAARSPVATIATALLDIGLIVNFDCPLGRYL